MNKADRWHRISELFDRVVELPAPEREAVLASECADDPPLRTEVERLLQADERTNPVDQDIAGQASALLLEGDPHEHEGQQFGPYRIVKLLAQGGMGRVYLAEREGEDFAQTVALKLVGGHGSFDAYTARRRFLDERRILARLQHPNIARLLDGGVGPEAQPWFAMEYVDGAPLTDWCDTQRLGVRERLNLFAKVCEAVDHAHRFLIVHRDLKPGNVLVDGRGEPKVLDFGIAKLLDEGAADRTGSTILMTPDYAAPEQIRGGQISTATDVYALGAVLFEVLTGRKPFCDPLAPRDAPQASRVATEGKHTGERAQARATTPQALRKQLRGDVDRILRTALDPDPARRYRSAETMAQDLRAVADGNAISLRSDRGYRIGIFLRRHKWETAAAAVAVLGLLGTTGWALWQTGQATEQSRRAAAHAREETRQARIAEREALASQKVSDLLVSSFEQADPALRKTIAEPTARDILDGAAARVSEELADTPALRARIRMMLGRAYKNMEDNDPAAAILEASIADYLSGEVNDPMQAATAMGLLAEVEMRRKRPDSAVELATRALKLQQSRGSPTPKELVDSYNTLGMTAIGAMRFDIADRALDSSQRYSVQVYGDPSPDLATIINNRGALASSAGKVRHAERLFDQALAMRIKVNASPYAVFATRNLRAIAIGRQGRLKEAQAVLEPNLAVAEKFYGPKSPKLATHLQRLGDVYRDQGDWTRAEAAYQRDVEVQSVATGPLSADVIGDLLKLAEMTEVRGDIEQARRLYARVEQALRTAPQVPDLTKWRTIARHGLFRARHGGSGPTPEEWSTARARWIGRYGRGGEECPWDLAEARFIEAEQRLLSGRGENLADILPPEDPSLEQPMIQARRHYFLARAAALQGDHVAALADYKRAIGIAEGIASRASAWPALWRLDYAASLALSGRDAEAAKQLAQAAPVLKEQMLPDSPALARLSRMHRKEIVAAK